MIKFQDLVIQSFKEFPHLLPFLIKIQAAVDEHFIFPNAAAPAEEAVGKSFEEDSLGRNIKKC